MPASLEHRARVYRHLESTMPDAFNLTKAQRRELQAAARHHLGIVECYSGNGFATANWRLMMERLRLAGYVTAYVHGGYQITGAGREAIRS